MNAIKVFLPDGTAVSVQATNDPMDVTVTNIGALVVQDVNGRHVAGWAPGHWNTFSSDEGQVFKDQ